MAQVIGDFSIQIPECNREEPSSSSWKKKKLSSATLTRGQMESILNCRGKLVSLSINLRGRRTFPFGPQWTGSD